MARAAILRRLEMALPSEVRVMAKMTMMRCCWLVRTMARKGRRR